MGFVTRRSASYLSDAGQDLRFALRRLRRAPALGAAIILTMGLGLGTAAAIFTTFQAALIDPLPFADPDRLVHVWEVRAGTLDRSPTSYPTFLDWRARLAGAMTFEGYDASNVVVAVGDDSRMLRGSEVTAGFFTLLGVHMSGGRDFREGEDVPGGPRTAVVSASFARSALGGTPLDKTISVNGTPHLVVGVLPRTFHFALLQDADVFMPLAASSAARTNRAARLLSVVARLRDDTPLTSARGRLSIVMADLAREHTDALAGRTVVVESLRDALLGTIKPIMISLLIAVAILLAAMAASLALLMLTRYMERAPELAMRSALGASRARVFRQLLVESIALSFLGGALAIGLGQIATRELLAAIPDGVRIGMPYLEGAGLDARVIGVLIGVATVLAVAFGVGPALLVTRPWRHAGDARATPVRGDRRLRRSLVVAQIALTVALLVSAGLLFTSFNNLVQRGGGFSEPEALVTARLSLSGARYQTPAAQQQFYETLVARSAALPGVVSAAVINQVPGVGGGGVTSVAVVDRPRTPSTQPRVALRIVGGAYFSTMRMTALAGRVIESRDRSNAPNVAVVSASLARLLGADGLVVGRRLKLAATGGTEWEVAGVVGDVQVAALDADSPPVIYVAHLQAAENRMSLILRTNRAIADVTAEVRAMVRATDATVPVYAVATLQQQMSDSRAVFSRLFPMLLCGVFAASALALALVALYAICAHDALMRRREFGIRLALGGSPAAICRMILNDGLVLAISGIGIGGMVALLVSRSLNALLFGIAATDWRVYAAVAAGVLASALLATLRPALRAASVDPSVVMRSE